MTDSKAIVGQIEKEVLAIRDEEEPMLCVSMIGLRALLSECPAWFDLEINAKMNAHRYIGYAYGVVLKLGRLEGEPGNWNC